MTLTKNLVVSGAYDVDDGRNVRLSLVLCASLLGDERPELVKVQRGAPVLLLRLVVVTHTDLTEVTRVIFIKVDSVMVLTSCVTATTAVLAVLANTAVAVAHVPPHLSTFLRAGRHSRDSQNRKE